MFLKVFPLCYDYGAISFYNGSPLCLCHAHLIMWVTHNPVSHSSTDVQVVVMCQQKRQVKRKRLLRKCFITREMHSIRRWHTQCILVSQTKWRILFWTCTDNWDWSSMQRTHTSVMWKHEVSKCAKTKHFVSRRFVFNISDEMEKSIVFKHNCPYNSPDGTCHMCSSRWTIENAKAKQCVQQLGCHYWLSAISHQGYGKWTYLYSALSGF